MRISKTIIIIGCLLFVLPFLGIPYLWKQIVGGVCGAILIYLGLRLWRQSVSIIHA